MSERRIEAFFYGLYMDLDVFREAGVAPLAPRKAYVDGFALRIGRRATLLPSSGARAYQWDASRDYNASADLERIEATLLVINSADDERNPPELGLLDREIKRVKNGRVL